MTIPTTVSLTRYVNYVDDFRSGGVTTGAIGELGWTLTTAGNLVYTNESLHPGILEVYGSAVANCAISLDSAAQKFAEKSVWSAEWIFKTPTDGIQLNGLLIAVTDVFVVEIRNVSDVYTLYIDGVTTNKTCVANEWITVQNSCDGGTTAYCNITKDGVVWHQTSKAVSSTTINKYLRVDAQHSSSYISAIYVDKARLSLGATR
jgi:hypothetical protein